MINSDLDLLPPLDIKTIANSVHIYAANITDALSTYSISQIYNQNQSVFAIIRSANEHTGYCPYHP